jgi:hypothetical protein
MSWVSCATVMPIRLIFILNRTKMRSVIMNFPDVSLLISINLQDVLGMG